MSLFNQLLRLRKHYEYRTPLEDFTTEILAGVLNSNHEIKRKFIQDFLQIKEDDEYTIQTQSRYRLEGDIGVRLQFDVALCPYLIIKSPELFPSPLGANQLSGH